MTEEEFLAFAHAKPLRKEFMLAMGRKGFPPAEMQAALERLARTLVRMDGEIAKGAGPWLLGERATLADVCVMPTIVRLADLGLQTMWTDKPRIARWLDAVRAHPAFTPTYYFGSLLTERFPHLKGVPVLTA
jgi:glutathione S-transferase